MEMNLSKVDLTFRVTHETGLCRPTSLLFQGSAVDGSTAASTGGQTPSVGTPPQNVTATFDTGSLRGTNITTRENLYYCRSSFDVRKSEIPFHGQTFEDFNIWVATGPTSFDIGIFGKSANDDFKKSFAQVLADSGKIFRVVFSLDPKYKRS
ncbi:uncharacterized protein YALI1_C19450g [Yarrowia lipolytica]|uniref:Uncharacterized protein n=2 Tax=Yarrowia lipolytica TaxID=4952 RepID=A0A1D8NB36_YARLL|nr:hypothetical protein YALI1_C19450g [Yarrowia lipolytica]